MRYAVFGPREFRFKLYDNALHVDACLATLKDFDGLLAGGGLGVEALAEQYAQFHKIEITRVPPNYQADAGVIITTREAFDTRNIQMISEADAVVMFWDGHFANMVPIMSRCMFMNKKVILYPMI